MVLAIVVILLCIGITPLILLFVKTAKSIHETKSRMRQNREEIEKMIGKK